MTDPVGTSPDTELDPESSTDEATADVNQEGEATADVSQEKGEEEETADYREIGEEKAKADYQTRLEEFDNVETPVPVVSLPVETRDLDKSDLEV